MKMKFCGTLKNMWKEYKVKMCKQKITKLKKMGNK